MSPAFGLLSCSSSGFLGAGRRDAAVSRRSRVSGEASPVNRLGWPVLARSFPFTPSDGKLRGQGGARHPTL